MSSPLDKFPFFEELGEEGREVLAGFLTRRTIRSGFQIFGSSDEACEMLIIGSGQVLLRLQSEEVGRLGPGDVLGGLSLVVIGRRECEAIAEVETELLSLSCEGYLRLRADHPQVALSLQEGVLRSVAGTLRTLLPECMGAG